MATERQYIVKGVDGEEYGPVDQDALIRWAQSGRVTAQCKVRSTLLARWEDAGSVSFLRDTIAAQIEPEEEYNPTLLGRIKTRASLKAAKVNLNPSLQREQAAGYKSPPTPLRLVSGITDVVVLLIFTFAVYLLMGFLYNNGLDSTSAFYFGVVLAYTGALMYYTWMVYRRGQTIGQRLWGLLVIHREGADLFLGRCFLFGLGTLLFGVLTPFAIFVLPSERGLQDIFSGTRVVKTKLVGNRR